MLFDGLSETKYPVYEKDSLLNTNSNFDYGDFADLPVQLAGQSNVNFVSLSSRPASTCSLMLVTRPNL